MAEGVPTVVQSSQLEQYLLLAKTAKGAAAAELIKQVTEAPGVYVFGELLEMPHIRELAEGPHSAYYALLNLFAFGTYASYQENRDQFPPLSPAMVTKLRHLTVVSLATKSKCIPYDTLLKELDMRSLRELEDLIIEAIYADVVRGKLDQKNNRLEVDLTIGRDIRPADVATVVKVLQEWCASCEAVLDGIECQMSRANAIKDAQMKTKQQIENEVNAIKKNLKMQAQDVDDRSEVRDEAHADKPSKKQAKGKAFPHQSRR